MNILTTENFSAQRQPSGEVWITCRHRPRQHNWAGSDALALQDGFTIKIPKEDCERLAKLLCPELEKPVYKMIETT